jgi:phage tail protein X
MADPTTYFTSQGDTLDFVCWKFYGQQSGAVEAVLASNPGLADLGPVLPINTRMVLPVLSSPAREVQPIRLWS